MRNKLDAPSLRQLRAFEAVARRKSIGAAAAELGLSQPAVTQMVAQLETALAVNLLERRRTGTYLTALGSVLLPRVERLFAHIQTALCDPVIGASLSGRETTKSVENKITDTHIRALTAIADGGTQAQYIPAGAASIGSRSRARDSKKSVPANGAGIGADVAGA